MTNITGYPKVVANQKNISSDFPPSLVYVHNFGHVRLTYTKHNLIQGIEFCRKNTVKYVLGK